MQAIEVSREAYIHMGHLGATADLASVTYVDTKVSTLRDSSLLLDGSQAMEGELDMGEFVVSEIDELSLVTQTTAAVASPAAGRIKIYMNSTDSDLHLKDPSGVDRRIPATSGPGELMTVDTAQDCTATKTFTVDQKFTTIRGREPTQSLVLVSEDASKSISVTNAGVNVAGPLVADTQLKCPKLIAGDISGIALKSVSDTKGLVVDDTEVAVTGPMSLVTGDLSIEGAGSLVLRADAVDTATLSAAAQTGGSKTFQLPAITSASASFIVSTTDQAIAGKKTFDSLEPLTLGASNAADAAATGVQVAFTDGTQQFAGLFRRPETKEWYLSASHASVTSGTDVKTLPGAELHAERLVATDEFHLNKDISASALGSLNVGFDMIAQNQTSTGGHLHALQVAQVNGGAAQVWGLACCKGIGPLRHCVGEDFNPDETVKVLSGVASAWAPNDAIFLADNDDLYVGHTSAFSSIRVVLGNTPSAFINARFRYWNSASSAWTLFYPNDTTEGFLQSGIIEMADLPGWGSTTVGPSTGYFIEIRRLKNVLATPPIVTGITVTEGKTNSWDKDGNISTSGTITASKFKAASDPAGVALESLDGAKSIKVTNTQTTVTGDLEVTGTIIGGGAVSGSEIKATDAVTGARVLSLDESKSVRTNNADTLVTGPLSVTDTLNAAKATNQIVLGSTSATTTTITAPAPAASRVLTIPDKGGDGTFILSVGDRIEMVPENSTKFDKIVLYEGTNGSATNFLGFGVAPLTLCYNVWNTSDSHTFFQGGAGVGNSAKLLQVPGDRSGPIIYGTGGTNSVKIAPPVSGGAITLTSPTTSGVLLTDKTMNRHFSTISAVLGPTQNYTNPIQTSQFNENSYYTEVRDGQAAPLMYALTMPAGSYHVSFHGFAYVTIGTDEDVAFNVKFHYNGVLVPQSVCQSFPHRFVSGVTFPKIPVSCEFFFQATNSLYELELLTQVEASVQSTYTLEGNIKVEALPAIVI